MPVRVELIDEAVDDLVRFSEAGNLPLFLKKLIRLEEVGREAGLPLGGSLVGWRKIVVGDRTRRLSQSFPSNQISELPRGNSSRSRSGGRSFLPARQDGFEGGAVAGAVGGPQGCLVLGDELSRVAGVESLDPGEQTQAFELGLVDRLHRDLPRDRAEMKLVDRRDYLV